MIRNTNGPNIRGQIGSRYYIPYAIDDNWYEVVGIRNSRPEHKERIVFIFTSKLSFSA